LITFKQKGDFSKTEAFLRKAKSLNFRSILDKYGAQGVSALEQATPKDSGVTANSWRYDIATKRSGFSIVWSNSSMNGGIPIVILLQYGHGTRGGTFVRGRDFINPTMKPIFDDISANLWKEVTNL